MLLWKCMHGVWKEFFSYDSIGKHYFIGFLFIPHEYHVIVLGLVPEG